MNDDERPASDAGRPLDYAPPRPRGGKVLRCVQGVLASFGILLTAIAGVLTDSMTAAWVVLAVAIAVIVVLAIRMGRRPGWEPFAAGMWIGLGIGALVEGTCFAMLTSLQRALG
jgi:hypothetical protein